MKENQKRKLGYLLMVIVNTVIVFGLYYLMVDMSEKTKNMLYFKAVFIVYAVLFTGLIVWYLIYNRALSRKGVTVDMLPDAWDDAKKHAFIEDGKRRMERSKWMLTMIIPFVFLMAYEVLNLYLLDSLKSLFSFS